MSSQVVRVALAGISGYGDAYLEALFQPGRDSVCRLVGAVDPAPHRCRRIADLKARGVPVLPALGDLLAATGVDLLLIATPIHYHAPQTCLALSHGVPVLCEKPIAGSVADALKMAEAQRHAAGSAGLAGPLAGRVDSHPAPPTTNGNANGRARGAPHPFIAIGFQWSFSDAVQSLKRDVIAGAFGRPRRLRSLAHMPRPRAYFRRNDWAGRVRAPGGEAVLDSPVNNATAHFLHNMLYLLGPTRETSTTPASVRAELYRANDIENYDTAAMRVVTSHDVEVLFYTTLAAPHRHGPVCHFEFDDAVVEYDHATGGRFVARFKTGHTRDYGTPNLDRHEKIWQCAESVRTGAPVACGIDGAMAHTLCVAAAHDSCPEVAEFPDAIKRTTLLDDLEMTAVDGLGEAFLDCYHRGVLPSERLGIPWARPARNVDVLPAAHPRRIAAAPARTVAPA